MTDNEKLTRWQTGLDQVHDALLDAGDREALGTEVLEDEIITDGGLFTRLALLYARGNTDGPPSDGFLEFGVRTLRRERDPQFTRAWRDPLEVNP